MVTIPGCFPAEHVRRSVPAEGHAARRREERAGASRHIQCFVDTAGPPARGAAEGVGIVGASEA